MIRNVLLCSLISLFFCCCLSHPSPTLQNLTLTHGSQSELTDTSSLIIRLLERPGPHQTLWTQRSRSYCWNVDWDRWTGAFGLKRLCGVISVPSAACLLAKLRQQLWFLRHVLVGREDYFHRKNIFIDEPLSFVRGCFAPFCVWFASL